MISIEYDVGSIISTYNEFIYSKYFPEDKYCTCIYLCNLIILYGHLVYNINIIIIIIICFYIIIYIEMILN